MKLYTLTNADEVSSPDHGTFKVKSDGSVIVPDELGRFLHAINIQGSKAWETEDERSRRLQAEADAEKASPEYLAKLVEGLTAQVAAQAAKPARAPRAK
jgi:protein involved in polysaccharide export with SLBB domain